MTSNPAPTFTLAPVAAFAIPGAQLVADVVGARFAANRDQLDDLCDKIFGTARNWAVYRDEVFLEWGRVSGPDAPDGAGASSFFCARILVARGSGNEQEVRTVVTQLYVERVWAMTVSREIFGFPAVLATFEGALDGYDVVVKAVGDAGAEPVTVFKSTPNAQQRAPSPLKSSSQQLGFELYESDQIQVPFVQLKQMRDGLQPDRASYQVLVEGSLGVTFGEQPSDGMLMEARFGENAALQASDLGLTSPCESNLGYQLKRVALEFNVTSPVQNPIVRTGRDGPAVRLRRGDPQAGPSYEFAGVEIVGFRIPVAFDKLKTICDQWLNDPFPDRSYRYQPANVDMVVECLYYPSMKAENPPFGISPNAIDSQCELVFRMLVGRVGRDGRIRSPAVFCPFVFVDSPLSLISGREVIGYPKSLASFEPIGGKGQFEACKIVAPAPRLGLPDQQPLVMLDCRFERDPPDVADLFDQKERAAPKTAREQPQVPVNFAWWGLADLQSGGEDGETFIAPWLQGSAFGYSGVQLKRFPDAADPSRACYAEVVEADYTLLQAEVRLPQYKASLHFPNDVYGLMRAFGLSPIVPVPPNSWYRTRADFRFRVTDPLA